jgi:hypothetical protein
MVRKPNTDKDGPPVIDVPRPPALKHAAELEAHWREYPPERVIDPDQGVFVFNDNAFLSGAREAGIPLSEVGAYLAATSIDVKPGDISVPVKRGGGKAACLAR